MWISEESGRPAIPCWARRGLEALGLAVLLGFLPELVRARSGAILEPHPGWLAVLVLAARDGSGGLFAGLIATAVAVGIGSAVAGAEPVASFGHLHSGPNLVAFGVCLVVCWVASLHLRRQADLSRRLRVSGDRVSETEATIQAFREVVSTLRARLDRASHSLSFLRDVAARLDGTDMVAAAEGAADLALARTGASAAAVRGGVNGSRRLLAVRDVRGPMGIEPLALRDADLTVPIRDGTRSIGVIALWGIPGSRLDDATAHDLALIASWCSRSLALGATDPVGHDGSAL